MPCSHRLCFFKPKVRPQEEVLPLFGKLSLGLWRVRAWIRRKAAARPGKSVFIGMNPAKSERCRGCLPPSRTPESGALGDLTTPSSMSSSVRWGYQETTSEGRVSVRHPGSLPSRLLPGTSAGTAQTSLGIDHWGPEGFLCLFIHSPLILINSLLWTHRQEALDNKTNPQIHSDVVASTEMP